MAILKRKPHPFLQPFIKEYWYLYIADAHPGLQTTVIPEQCLYFYPKANVQVQYEDNTRQSYPSAIAAPSLHRPIIFWEGEYVMLKVLFHPSGFFRLFGIPMTHLQESLHETLAVLGNPLKELYERIEEAANFTEMIAILESYFLKKAQNPAVETRPIDIAINAMLQPVSSFSLDNIAKAAYLSPRQLERNFVERVGVMPKLYSRMVRFNQALNLKQNNPSQSWLHIAYDSGYYDQMHLLRDFKSFTAKVPSDFDFNTALIY